MIRQIIRVSSKQNYYILMECGNDLMSYRGLETQTAIEGIGWVWQSLTLHLEREETFDDSKTKKK